jgi:predicted RNA-binding protein YlqC (UPF0109 family)
MTMSVFNSYAALVAASPSSGDTALLLGYRAKGDGGGGNLYWDSASTATHNGGTIIQPAGGGTGRWFRIYDRSLDVKWFGATGGGVFGKDGAITASDNTFTSASASFTSADVGKLIKVGRAASSGRTLVTTIASINSSTSVELTAAAGTTASGAYHTYGTDDQDAIEDALAACWDTGVALDLPDGRYCFSGSLNFAHDDFAVNALGANVWLETFRTTSGNAVDLNGSARSAGIVFKFHFGGAHKINVRGNSNCFAAVCYNGLVQSSVRVRAWDAAVGVLGDNAGSADMIAAVSCYLDFEVGLTPAQSFDIVPAVGLYVRYTYTCRGTLIAESCGSSDPTFGVYMTVSNGNVWTGGTAEGNLFGGVVVTDSCTRNTFIGMHNELNGQGPDWQIDGSHTILIGCAGVGTYATLATAANIINGDYTCIEGGEFRDLQISSGAEHARVIGANLATGTVTVSSDTAVFEDCNGVSWPSGTVTALPLTTGFTNRGAPYSSASYFRPRSGMVQLEGVITCGTVIPPQKLGTLPVGSRPSATVLYNGYNLTTEVPFGLSVNSSGEVSTRAGVSTGDVVSISSPAFRV